MALTFDANKPPRILLPTVKGDLRRVLRLLNDDILDSLLNSGVTLLVNSKKRV